MSSFYEDASLVMIPSGYKTSKVYSAKPTDGAGDLTFSRSNDTATRVASNGLIEKVRTNLVSYSEQFDNAFWTKRNTTVVANSGIAPNGTTTAELVYPTTTGSNRLLQKSFSISAATPYTGTWYLKASGLNWVAVDHIDGNVGAWFNLSTGTIGTIAAGTTASIEDVGNGWYRCRISRTSVSTTGYQDIRLVDGDNTISVTANGTDGLLVWGAQLETGDIATPYIPTTTTAVSVGPVANLPRIDYTGGGCGKLLLEPQSTALNQFSEQIDNAYWTKANCTVTANQTASPSGYVDGELVLDDTSNSQHVITRSIAITSGSKYTASFFLKAAGYTTAAIRMGNGSLWTGGTGPTVEFDFVALTGTVVDGSGVTFTIEDYGNGWRRCSVTGTCVTSGNTVFSLYVKQYAGYIGNGTDGIYAWGANITATGYPQSYIPTLGSTVTRLADECSKTSISSLIGQTQGTLFLEANISNLSEARRGIALYADANNFITLRITSNNDLQFLVYASGATQANFTIANPQGSVKMALAYKANDFATYLNGTLVGTDTNGTVPATSQFYLGYDPSGSLQIAGGIAQALLFKTRLSNEQLQKLTSL